MPSAKLWKEYAEYIENKYKGRLNILHLKIKEMGGKIRVALD